MDGDATIPHITGRYADRTIWGRGQGWFSASFGPFRRFSGGDNEYDRLFYTNPGLARHLSAFGEDVALGEALRWLQDLRFKQYERDDTATRLLQGLIGFLARSQLLPHGAHIDEIIIPQEPWYSATELACLFPLNSSAMDFGQYSA